VEALLKPATHVILLASIDDETGKQKRKLYLVVQLAYIMFDGLGNRLYYMLFYI
jgi:hypothetical protein